MTPLGETCRNRFECRSVGRKRAPAPPLSTTTRRTTMADLTTLEEKLAEVLGLAQAAQGATEKVEGLVEDDGIASTLKQMREEAEETERRCTELADARDGKKTAILEKAQETKGEATDMMSTYLGDDSD